MKVGTVLLIVQCALIVALAVLIPVTFNSSSTLLLCLIPADAIAIAGIAFARTVIKNKANKTSVGAAQSKINGKLKHVDGLPVAKDVMVDIYYTPAEIIFVKDAQTIKVQCEKVTSVDYVSSKDASKALSGAAAGLLLGGVLGAAVGATAEAFYLVITYESGGEQKFITFEDNKQTLFASKFAKAFRAEHQQQSNVVEL